MQNIELTEEVFLRLSDLLYSDIDHEIDIKLNDRHDPYPVTGIEGLMNGHGSLDRVVFSVDMGEDFYIDPVFMFEYEDRISIEVRHTDGHVIEI